MSHAAELSIVVVATNLLQVTRCLESLSACQPLDGAGITLVSQVDCSTLQQRFPRLRIVEEGSAWSMPRARAEGLRTVSTAWAAVLSEDYRVGDGWAEAALSRREQADVLVGEVLPPLGGLFAHAVYLWEYLHAAPPAATGELTREQARWAPAGAVVYRMAALEIDAIQNSHSEMEYHRAMFDAGKRFYRDPRLQIRFAPLVEDYLSARMRRSRECARLRSRSMPLAGRWLAGASRISLPAVLVGRFAARAARRPRYWARTLAALPFALLFAAVEAMGEIDGYLRRTV